MWNTFALIMSFIRLWVLQSMKVDSQSYSAGINRCLWHLLNRLPTCLPARQFIEVSTQLELNWLKCSRTSLFFKREELDFLSRPWTQRQSPGSWVCAAAASTTQQRLRGKTQQATSQRVSSCGCHLSPASETFLRFSTGRTPEWETTYASFRGGQTLIEQLC